VDGQIGKGLELPRGGWRRPGGEVLYSTGTRYWRFMKEGHCNPSVTEKPGDEGGSRVRDDEKCQCARRGASTTGAGDCVMPSGRDATVTKKRRKK
jgi:hypothetical protein